MKIGFVSDVVYPFMKGGVERTEKYEMEKLAETHEVYSFSLLLEGMTPKFSMNGVHHRAFGRTSKERLFSHGARSISQALKFALLLPFHLFAYRLDVIQANAFPYLHLPAVKLYCMLTGCRLVIDVAEVWSGEYWRGYIGTIKGSIGGAYANHCLRLGDAYIVNSSTTASALIGIGVPQERMFIFNPNTDTRVTRRIRAKRYSNRRCIIAVGRMIKEKNLDKFLKAVREVKRKVKDANALLIGDGPERIGLEEMAERLGLKRSVEFAPPKESQEEVFGQMHDATVMLHMSRREGLGAVIIQCLAVGTPVVLPSDTPVPEEVKRMCVVVDESKIPTKVAEILRSRDKKKYLKHAEGLRVYGTDAILQEYSEVFKTLGVE